MDSLIIYAVQIETLNPITKRLDIQIIAYARNKETADRIRNAYARGNTDVGYYIVVQPIFVQ